MLPTFMLDVTFKQVLKKDFVAKLLISIIKYEFSYKHQSDKIAQN